MIGTMAIGSSLWQRRFCSILYGHSRVMDAGKCCLEEAHSNAAKAAQSHGPRQVLSPVHKLCKCSTTINSKLHEFRRVSSAGNRV